MELPGCQARTLKIWARFGHEDFDFASALDGHANYAECCAYSAGGERAGIALRHYAAGLRHEFRAEAADGFVGVAALLMNLQRFGDERFAQPRHTARTIALGFARRGFKHAFAALDGPEKIDGCRPRLRQRLANFRKFVP